MLKNLEIVTLSDSVSLTISLGVIIALRALAMGVLKKPKNVVLAHQKEKENFIMFLS